MTELEALLLSVAIDTPIAFAIGAITRWPCRGPLHAAVAISLATAVTHPQLWAAALWLYPRIGDWPTIGGAEAVVGAAEAGVVIWATALSPARALVLSIVANGASTLAGLLLFD